MTNDKNAAQEAALTVRAPQRVLGFDPMKYARQATNKAGEKVLLLDLKHKKAWFRMACPNGGMVLNPLRVTDQMAIFEARLFADTGDSNPLASFTATRTADKATGTQYIRAAQEDALNEALENAGFGLPLIPVANDSGQKPVTPAGQMEARPKTVDDGKPAETPPVAAPKQAAADVRAAPNEAPPVQQPNSENKTAPRPAPVSPQPHAAETPRPAPVGPQPRRDAGTVSSAPAVVDIAAARSSAGEVAQPAARQEQIATAVQPVTNIAAERDTPAPAVEDAPVTYTADMTVEEIRQRMTLEQAKKIKVQDGTCKGWTLEQVARDRPPSLKWLKFTAPFADNVLKAAASIVLDDLELKKAG